MLPKEAIKEYKEIYLKNYGVELTDEEATRRANNLVALYAAVYGEPAVGPLKRNEDKTNN